MYRCTACDTPAEMGHHDECPMVDDDDYGIRMSAEEETRINIASGEDVQLEPVYFR